MTSRAGAAHGSSRWEGAIDQDLVLIIEDDPQLARFVTRTLRLEGFTSHLAGTGAEGLDAARRYRPAVIVLDLMLPGIDGLEVLRRLKADPETATIPVVVFSAADWSAAEQRVRGLGAAVYLPKPASAADLIAAVRSALRPE